MRVRALEAIFYSRHRGAGDVFDTESDLHAQMLIQNGKVEMVIDDDEKPPKRQRYRRSDMRAEE